MTNPMTAAGDIIIGGASGAPTRLARGTDGQVLTLTSGSPAWAAGGGQSVTISGNLTLYVTQQTTLTITNFDSATTYGVSVVSGTVSRTGDTITYTAGNTAGIDTLTITAGAATRAVAIAVNAASVVTPTITSPADGATGVTDTVIFTTSAFATNGLTDTHAKSSWELRTAPNGGGTLVASSYDDTTNKISWSPSTGTMQTSILYYIRCKHTGTTIGDSQWGESSFTTASVFPKIVGVCCTATGGDGGTWAYIDKDGNTITAPDSTYFNSHPVFGGIQDATIDSQVMVKIPRFYYKRAIISGGANNGKEAWWISDLPVSGFTIHPAFRNAGADIDQFYYGKYQASSDGTKLKSVAGVLPVGNISLTQAIAQATARNVGE